MGITRPTYLFQSRQGTCYALITIKLKDLQTKDNACFVFEFLYIIPEHDTILTALDLKIYGFQHKT